MTLQKILFLFLTEILQLVILMFQRETTNEGPSKKQP